MAIGDFFEKRLQDLARLAQNRDIVVFTDFLNLEELNIVKNTSYQWKGIRTEYFGGLDFSERQIAALIPDALSYAWEYPIVCLHIELNNRKFHGTLTHRNYLGAVLNLGIERSKIGDIYVGEHDAYLFCHEQMEEFICRELFKVGNEEVSLAKVYDFSQIPSPKFEMIKDTISSLRLDAIIARGFKLSRSSIIKYIEGGKVYVNGKLITSNGHPIKEEDLISVRGLGRLRFLKTVATTKKNRYWVEIQKYI